MSSALITCPPIGKRRIQRNDEARALIVDGMLKRFTPTEYRLLVLLLEGQPIPDADLVKQVSSYQGDSRVRENLDKHIDKLRCKLRTFGLSIHRVTKYGYILLAAIE